MCHDMAAIPPIEGPATTTASCRRFSLISSDGTAIGAFGARPERSQGPAVLVLPDNGGLSPFYERLAARLAELGHPALAIDYYGRTAGDDYASRDEGFRQQERLMAHLGRLTRDEVVADLLAGISYLRTLGPDDAPVVSLGFCLGGRFAFYTAAERFALAGVIGLYGYPDELNGAPGPIQLADGFTAPILGLFGGADAGIPPAMVARFAAVLERVGVEHEFVTYPRAPHGFFEAGLTEFADESADAWRRILAFLAARRPTAAPAGG